MQCRICTVTEQACECVCRYSQFRKMHAKTTVHIVLQILHAQPPVPHLLTIKGDLRIALYGSVASWDGGILMVARPNLMGYETSQQ